jgi:hypothetical protein
MVLLWHSAYGIYSIVGMGYQFERYWNVQRHLHDGLLSASGSVVVL